MRVAAPQVTSLLRDPSSLAGLLVYGEDSGLVRSRSRAAARAVLGSDDDPFRSSVLVSSEHSRVFEEARSRSLTGARRVVRVLDAGDALAATLSRLQHHEGDPLLIVEAGALTSRSKLRSFAEKSSGWASISCHLATPASVVSEVKAMVIAAGGTITSESASMLATVLPSDTAARRSEVEKLITFSGHAGLVDHAAVECCLEMTLDVSFNDLFDAALSGDVDRTSLLFQQACHGETGPGVLAAFSTHLHRILKLALLIEAGLSPDAACQRLFPPPFPRQMAGLLRQVNACPVPNVMHVLESVKTADLACKRAGSADKAIVAQLMLATARNAAGHRSAYDPSFATM